MKLPYTAWAVVCALVLATGCGESGAMASGADASGSGSGSSGGNADYGQTKQMVVDILHSKEGQAALEEIAKSPSFKQSMAVSETDVTKAVEKTIQDQKSQSFLAKQASSDPKFADALAQAITPQLTQINKNLMKDPEYQKDMLVLMKSPEYTKDMQDLFQTPAFRGTIMQIMTDALDTPSFRMKFEASLKKAVSDAIEQAGGQGGKSKEKGGQQGGSGGGGGDSGSEGGGGGGSSGGS